MWVGGAGTAHLCPTQPTPSLSPPIHLTGPTPTPTSTPVLLPCYPSRAHHEGPCEAIGPHRCSRCAPSPPRLTTRAPVSRLPALLPTLRRLVRKLTIRAQVRPDTRPAAPAMPPHHPPQRAPRMTHHEGPRQAIAPKLSAAEEARQLLLVLQGPGWVRSVFLKIRVCICVLGGRAASITATNVLAQGTGQQGQVAALVRHPIHTRMPTRALPHPLSPHPHWSTPPQRALIGMAAITPRLRSRRIRSLVWLRLNPASSSVSGVVSCRARGGGDVCVLVGGEGREGAGQTRRALHPVADEAETIGRPTCGPTIRSMKQEPRHSTAQLMQAHTSGAARLAQSVSQAGRQRHTQHGTLTKDTGCLKTLPQYNRMRLQIMKSLSRIRLAAHLVVLKVAEEDAGDAAQLVHHLGHVPAGGAARTADASSAAASSAWCCKREMHP